MFSFGDCTFTIDRSKMGCARVVVFSQLGIPLSYTMESSYCGFDRGEYRGRHIGVGDMGLMGARFCHGLLYLDRTTPGGEKFDPDKMLVEIFVENLQ